MAIPSSSFLVKYAEHDVISDRTIMTLEIVELMENGVCEVWWQYLPFFLSEEYGKGRRAPPPIIRGEGWNLFEENIKKAFESFSNMLLNTIL